MKNSIQKKLIFACLAAVIIAFSIKGAAVAHTVNNNTYCTVSHNHHCSKNNKNHRQTLLYVAYLESRNLRLKACRGVDKSGCNHAKLNEKKSFATYERVRVEETRKRKSASEPKNSTSRFGFPKQRP